MRECERHPSESQPGGGVCASCLEERLAWLWRGESFRHDDMVQQTLASSSCSIPTTTTTTTTGLVVVDEEVLQVPELSAPSLASVRQQLQVLGVAREPKRETYQISSGVSSDAQNSKPTDSSPIIEEWAAFHASRRRRSTHSKNAEGLETVESKSESMDTEEHRAVFNPELRILMNAHKMRSQSMPLDFRSAEETAARVINECEDSYLEGDELVIYEQPVAQNPNEPQRCFSPKWQSPKWVKVLASPMTSRNRVFPSRSKDNSTDHVRKRSRNHKRGARLDSSDWGFHNGATTGGSSPLWRANATTKTRSVFSWLQDAETTQYKKYDQTEQLTSSSSSDSWLRDLTTVGHLHEIAEELEIVEESSEEEGEEGEEEEEQPEDLGDVSSFGKFLLQAAQRHPTNAHLTKLVSAP